jgi:hypothetical protein
MGIVVEAHLNAPYGEDPLRLTVSGHDAIHVFSESVAAGVLLMDGNSPGVANREIDSEVGMIRRCFYAATSKK